MNTSIDQLSKTGSTSPGVKERVDAAHAAFTKKHHSLESSLCFLRKKAIWLTPMIITLAVSIFVYITSTARGRYAAPASQWTEIDMSLEPGVTTILKFTDGVAFEYKINAESTVYESGPENERIDLNSIRPPGGIWSFWIRPAFDMEVRKEER